MARIDIYDKENYNKMMETKTCLCGLPGNDIPCMCEEFRKLEEGICHCKVFIKKK